MVKKTKPPRIEVLPESPPASPRELDSFYADLRARAEKTSLMPEVVQFVDDPLQHKLSDDQVSNVVELFTVLAEKHGFPWAEAVSAKNGVIDEAKISSWAGAISTEVQRDEFVLVGMAMKRILSLPPDRAERKTFVSYLEAKTGPSARAALKQEITTAKGSAAEQQATPPPESPKSQLAQQIWKGVKEHPVKAAFVAMGMLLAAIGIKGAAAAVGKDDESMSQSAMVSVGGTLAKLMGLPVTEGQLQQFVGNFRDTATEVGQAVQRVVQNPTDTLSLAGLSDSIFSASSARRVLASAAQYARIPDLERFVDVPLAQFQDQAGKLAGEAANRAKKFGEAVLADARAKGEDIQQSVGIIVRSLYSDDKGGFTPSAGLHSALS